MYVPPYQVLLELSQGPESAHWASFTRTAAAALAAFGAHLEKWRELSHSQPPLQLMDSIIDDIQYHDYLEDGTEEGRDRWENVMELRRLAAEYEQRDLGEFLEQLALVSDQDTIDETDNVPTLLTLHSAKGLEFGTVFIVGLNDGMLPHSRSFDDPDGLEEERRLL